MNQNQKQLPSTDVSPLWGYIFPPDLCDNVFALAVKVLGVDPNARESYVGTFYFTARCIEDIGKALLHKAIEDVREGVGEHTALAPLLDFKDEVNRLAYPPTEMYRRVKTSQQQAAEAPKTTPKSAAKKPVEAVKPGTKLGDTISPETKAELRQAIEPAPAPAMPEPKRPKRKGQKPETEKAAAETEKPVDEAPQDVPQAAMVG